MRTMDPQKMEKDAKGRFFQDMYGSTLYLLAGQETDEVVSSKKTALE